MKKLVAVLTLLSLVSIAQAERDDSREIQDLMYFPEAKTFYGVSTLDIVTGSNEFDTDFGSGGENEIFDRTITQQIGYSFSDRFLVTAEIFHRSSKIETRDDNNLDSMGTTEGLGDPTIGAKWRALDQRLHDVNVDVIPFITIKSGDPVSAGSDGDGNNKKGTAYGMEAQIGKKFSRDEFLTYVRLSHATNYLAKDDTTGSKTEFGFRTTYELGGRYQRSVTDTLFFNVTAGYLTTDASKDYDDPTTAVVKNDSLHTYFFGLESVITPYPNLALALSLDLRKTKDYSTETSGGNQTDYEKVKTRTISLWTRYSF